MNKKSLKEKVVAILCAGLVSFTPFMFVGCESNEKLIGSNQQQQTENQKLQEQVSAYDKLVANMKKGNFTYSETMNGKTTQSLFNGKSMKVGDKYYVSQDGKDYVVSQKDDKWQKDLSEISVSGELNATVSKFENIYFNSYNDSTLIGKDAKGNDVLVNKAANSITLTADGKTIVAENIGSTNFIVPTVEIDNTVDPEVLKSQLIENVEKYFKILAENKNFTFEVTLKGNTTKYNCDENVALVETNGRNFYYETKSENNLSKNYEYVLENSTWHKKNSKASLRELYSDVFALLRDCTWQDYNQQDGTLKGIVHGNPFTLSLADGIMSINVEKGAIIKISNVNSNAVKLPEEFVDETDLQNLLWIKDSNGEVKYNLVAMKEVLEKWLKGDNQFGKDFSKVYHLSDRPVTGPIIYINVAEDGVHVGNIRYWEDTNTKSLYDVVISGLLEKFKDGSVQTKNQLKDFMFSLDELAINNSNLTPRGITYEYSTVDEDYEEEHKAEFEKLTENLFDRLKNVGIQESSINKFDDTTKEDYNGSVILFGFRTKVDDSAAAFDMGYNCGWSQYYIIENQGKIKLVNFRLRGDSNGGADPIKSVLTDNKWIILRKEENFDISLDNVNTLLNPIMLVNTKTKEL